MIMTNTLRVTLLLVALTAALLPAPAAAQDSVGVVQLSKETVELGAPWLSTLRALAVRGDSDNLAKGATEFVKDLGLLHKDKSPDLCCDYTKNYYLVLFTAPDLQGKPALVHVLVHSPAPDAGASLPGLKGADHRLFEVFLAEDDSVSIQGSYDVERTENPAVKQLGDFVTTVITKSPLPAAASNISSKVALMGVAPGKKQDTFPHAVTLSAATIPYARAKLTGRHAAIVTRPVDHMKAVVTATTEQLPLAYRMNAIEALFLGVIGKAAEPAEIRCEGLITSTANALIRGLDADVCKFSVADQAECLKSLKAQLNESLKSAPNTDQKCAADDARAVVAAFQPALSDTTRVTGTTVLTNQPLQRFGFGLATGYIAAIAQKGVPPRAQIQSGKIAANPFARAISMGVVNLPLWGYDPGTFEPKFREKLRPFLGFAFTPYFGLTTGASWQLTRTIAVTSGYGRLWYDTPASGESIDAAPVNKSAPFDLASTNAWFIAAGYAFK